MNKRILITSMIALAMLIASCQSSTPVPTATPAPTNTSVPTLTSTPIPATPASTAGQAATDTATSAPTSTPAPSNTPTSAVTSTSAPTQTPTRRPTLAPTRAQGNTQQPQTAQPTQASSGSSQQGDAALKVKMIALKQAIQAVGGLNDDPSGSVDCEAFTNTYPPLLNYPSFDPAQLSPNGQAAYASYQAALAKVIDTSRDEYLFCVSVMQGTPTSPFIPQQHWELSRSGVDQALELLKPGLAALGVS